MRFVVVREALPACIHFTVIQLVMDIYRLRSEMTSTRAT